MSSSVAVLAPAAKPFSRSSSSTIPKKSRPASVSRSSASIFLVVCSTCSGRPAAEIKPPSWFVCILLSMSVSAVRKYFAKAIMLSFSSCFTALVSDFFFLPTFVGLDRHDCIVTSCSFIFPSSSSPFFTWSQPFVIVRPTRPRISMARCKIKASPAICGASRTCFSSAACMLVPAPGPLDAVPRDGGERCAAAAVALPGCDSGRAPLPSGLMRSPRPSSPDPAPSTPNNPPPPSKDEEFCFCTWGNSWPPKVEPLPELLSAASAARLSFSVAASTFCSRNSSRSFTAGGVPIDFFFMSNVPPPSSWACVMKMSLSISSPGCSGWFL
mmetsp:Transcript_8531/g.20635  ORF Transcript_8531/g.20635 Transcript_8531/m.20635 type:complete len:326 (-) Transcript_8531:1041-2018(-)